MLFKARQFEFLFPSPVLVMGILNITPDSFSDGGRYLDPDAAIDHALRMAAEGAAIIDVGGESTRPNAEPVAEKEELRRVLPVLERLSVQLRVPISIDTRKPAVARAALQAGASIINDIEASRSDDTMWRLAAETRAGYILMHMQGTPQTMQSKPAYRDVVADVEHFFVDRLDRAAAAGLTPEQIVLDVGIGFGKELEHTLALLAAMNRFTKLGRPLLLGVSRKSFIGKLLGSHGKERGAASLACACWAVQSGVQMIRTHDVRDTVQAVRMTENIIKNRK